MAAKMNQLADAGPQYVGPTFATRHAWNAGMDAGNTMGALANTGNQNYNFLSSAADVANNPYVQGMMGNNRAAAQRSLTEDFLPALGNQAQSAGGMGGSRQGVAQGMATDRAMRSMLEANNSLAMGAYGAGLGAQQNALSSLGALQQANAAPGLAYGAVGQSQEGYQQAAQDAQWRHLQNLGATQQYLNPLGTLLGTTKAPGTSASGPQGAYGPGANQAATTSGAPPNWYNQAPQWYQQQQPQQQQYQPFNQYGGAGYSGG
jgi:hypothetical protein